MEFFQIFVRLYIQCSALVYLKACSSTCVDITGTSIRYTIFIENSLRFNLVSFKFQNIPMCLVTQTFPLANAARAIYLKAVYKISTGRNMHFVWKCLQIAVF